MEQDGVKVENGQEMGGFRGRGGRGRGRGEGRGRGGFRGGRGGGSGGEFQFGGGRGGGGGEFRGRGGRGGRGGMGGMRNPEAMLQERLAAITGPTYDLPPNDQKEEKKFTNKCRLFVGNLTEGTTLEEFTDLFKPYGETTEPYMNLEKAFGFIKLDFRANAEKAQKALNGMERNGRTLKVRFSSVGSSLRVKRLSPWVSNELLELAFGVFGEIERAVVVVDERGKSTGEGIIDFAKKPAAQACLGKCTENSFFLTESLCPVDVEVLKEDDEVEGLAERALPKRHMEYQRERSVGPRFGQPGSFEVEYGNRWKQLYELEKQRREQLDQEMKLEMDKLREQMEYARREHETEMLREQLRMREQEQERSKQDWESRQQQREQERLRLEEEMQRRQEAMQSRMRQSEEDMKRRQQENKLFMQANELNSLLDQAVGQGSASGTTEETAYGSAAQDTGYSRWGQSYDQMGGAGMANQAAGGMEQGYGGGAGGRGRGAASAGFRGRGRGGFRGGARGGRTHDEDDFANKRPRMF